MDTVNVWLQLARPPSAPSHSDPQVLLFEAVGGDAGRAEGRRLCVVNTHLFGHPDAVHVRLIPVGPRRVVVVAFACVREQ